MNIAKKRSSGFDREQRENEHRILRSSNHPFIIGFKCSSETKNKLYFVMEYASEDSLDSVLKRVSKSKDFSDH